jgi:hypothetical protein
MDITVIWNGMPCSWNTGISISHEFAVSILKIEVKASIGEARDHGSIGQLQLLS